MELNGEVPRNSRYEGKFLMLGSMLLGFAAAALLTLPNARYNEESAINMAAAPSAMTKLQPRAYQFLEPVTAQRSMQRVSALSSPNEPERVIVMETPTKVSLEKRRDLIAAMAVAATGASAKDRVAIAAEMKKERNQVGQIGEGEPPLVNIGWGALCAMFSSSIALVIWGRSGL